MAPAAAVEQTFEFETMAVVIQAMEASGTILGDKHFALMATIDGKRSKSSFQHAFRAVKARAKEINTQIASGEIIADVPAVKTPAKAKAVRGEGKKTASGSKRKARSENTSATGGDEDDDEEAMAKTPSKKVKVVKEENGGNEFE